MTHVCRQMIHTKVETLKEKDTLQDMGDVFSVCPVDLSYKLNEIISFRNLHKC
jgi:hypothetical protein